jgi:hypothetical protein
MRANTLVCSFLASAMLWALLSLVGLYHVNAVIFYGAGTMVVLCIVMMLLVALAALAYGQSRIFR